MAKTDFLITWLRLMSGYKNEEVEHLYETANILYIIKRLELHVNHLRYAKHDGMKLNIFTSWKLYEVQSLEGKTILPRDVKRLIIGGK